MQGRKFQFRLTTDGFIVLAAFLLANLRATMFVYLHPDISVLVGLAWIEIALWLLAVGAVLYQLKRRNQVTHYLALWRRNWLLAAFLLLTFISVFWSLGLVVTFFAALELLFATLVAVYVAMLYRPAQFIDFLFWFGAILLILSIALVFGAPNTGTMYWAPFYGAWRGIYWHRNHLASITVLLNMVFLYRMLIAFKNRDTKGFLDGMFYVLSLIVLFFAKSATGYILFIVLTFFVFCCWLWIRSYQYLQKRHYYIFWGVFIAATILILLNLDFVFGLFNRSSNLTGRVGLWEYLLKAMVSQRPWWGHGFGVVWTLDAFREQVRQHVGWTSQPLIGDNGFMDILLHVGIVGLSLFLLVLAQAFIRSFRYAISNKTPASFFPLTVMIYVLFANISFSLFAETEVFVWLLIVLMLFATTSLPADKTSR